MADRRARKRNRSSKSLKADSVETPANDNEQAPVAKRWPLPWILFAITAVMSVTTFYRKDWMYAWSHDHTAAWANASFLWTGLVAAVAFVHACIATQVAANAYHSDSDQHKAVGAIYRIAATCSAGGAFTGSLLAFSAASGLPPEIKVTTLVSDLAVVGTIAGLAVGTPFYIAHTWRSLRWLAAFDRQKYAELMLVLSIFDGWALFNIARFLPGSAEFLAYIISVI